MITPKEYIYKERKKSGYFNKLKNVNQRQLEQYLEQIPNSKDRLKARKIWQNRSDKTLSDIWEETTSDYKTNLMIGLSDVPELKKIVDETYIGVLPTGEVNAFAKFAPNGERMIIVNEGLLYTIHYWSGFFLRSLEEQKDNFFWKNEELKEESLRWIFNIWNNKLSLDENTPEIFPKSTDGWKLSQALTNSSIVFVLSHEIGHIFHNHTKYSQDRIINHKMEIDADRIALETTFKYAYYRGIVNFSDDSYYTKFMLAAPYLIFSIFALFGINNSRTHPSVLDRIDIINKKYNKIAFEYLGIEKFKLLLEYLDLDIFEKLKKIGSKQLDRHLVYAKELNRLKY